MPVTGIHRKLVRFIPWLGACGFAVLPSASLAANSSFDAAAAFNARCSGCHSVGRGVVVGPDLHGVTSRHKTGWLHAFIRSSQGLVKRGDPSAVALFRQYQKTMPDHDLADVEIDALLGYITAGGPRGAERARPAAEATRAEIERGRDLFTGASPLAHGGVACSSCHSAMVTGGVESGTLAGDLSGIYLKHQDGGLTRALAESETPLMAAAYHDRPLTPEEVFALKAFLYQAGRSPERSPRNAAGSLAFLGLGVSPLALWVGRGAVRWRRRARRPERRTARQE